MTSGTRNGERVDKQKNKNLFARGVRRNNGFRQRGPRVGTGKRVKTGMEVGTLKEERREPGDVFGIRKREAELNRIF